MDMNWVIALTDKLIDEMGYRDITNRHQDCKAKIFDEVLRCCNPLEYTTKSIVNNYKCDIEELKRRISELVEGYVDER